MRRYSFMTLLHVTLSFPSIGTAHAGQLLAIIGPTGCGKTSLLNVLGERSSSRCRCRSRRIEYITLIN